MSPDILTPGAPLASAPPRKGLPPQRYADPVAWSEAHGQPFRQLSEQHALPLLLRQIDGQIEQVPYESPRMYLARMTGADLVPPHCAVWTSDDCIYIDGLGANDDAYLDALRGCIRAVDAAGNNVIGRPRRAATTAVETVFFGGHAPPGHFLGQDVARLAIAASSPETARLPIAVYDSVEPRNLEFLDLVGYPASRRLILPSNAATHFEAVWLASSPLYRRDAYRSRIWPEAIWWLRSHATRISGSWPAARPRLAIPRVGADWRRAVNQPEIDSVLARHGIDRLDFEALSAAERIRAVAHASLIVSFGGIGGELTMFAPSDCVIVEVAAPSWAGTFGPRAFAGIVGQPYARLVSSPATREDSMAAGLTPPDPSDQRPYDRICHFRTDCAELGKMLLLADMKVHQTIAP